MKRLASTIFSLISQALEAGAIDDGDIAEIRLRIDEELPYKKEVKERRSERLRREEKLRELFEQYWEMEPKKVCKDAAKKEWCRKFNKEKVFPAENFNAHFTLRLEEAESKRAEAEARGVTGTAALQYLKHPSTWLSATDFSEKPDEA